MKKKLHSFAMSFFFAGTHDMFLTFYDILTDFFSKFLFILLLFDVHPYLYFYYGRL